MDQNKRDQQRKDKSDPRQMGNEQDRSKQQNEEETGQPIQLDKEPEHQGGKDHQGNQPHNPQTERKPDQGQRTGQR